MQLEPAKQSQHIQQQPLGQPLSAGYAIPIELWEHIFSFFSPEDLAKISLTSKTFNLYSNDENL